MRLSLFGLPDVDVREIVEMLHPARKLHAPRKLRKAVRAAAQRSAFDAALAGIRQLRR